METLADLFNGPGSYFYDQAGLATGVALGKTPACRRGDAETGRRGLVRFCLAVCEENEHAKMGILISMPKLPPIRAAQQKEEVVIPSVVIAACASLAEARPCPGRAPPDAQAPTPSRQRRGFLRRFWRPQ